MKKNKSSRRNGFINSLYNAKKNIAYSIQANTPDFLLSNMTSTNIR